MSSSPLVETILAHLRDIAAGRCSITDAAVQREEDPVLREVLMGLRFLHEDVELRRQEQARAGQALRLTELRFNRLWNSGMIGILFDDEHGNIADANDAFLSMIGYTREDLAAGKVRWDALTPPEWRDTNGAVRDAVTKSGRAKPREREYIRKDGSRVPVLAGVAGIGDGNALSISIDLSDLKSAERLARATESKFSAFLDIAPNAIVLADRGGRIQLFNRRAETMFGRKASEALSLPLTVLMPERFHEAHRIGFERHLAGEQGRAVGKVVELVAARADGTEFPVELSLTSGRTPDGLFFAAVIRDITERKKLEAEARRHEQIAQQASRSKMEAIGVLAGGVAHDFNNLLSVILSYSEMILQDLRPGDPMRSDIEAMHTAGTRAADLTRQLLAFSRQQVLAPKILDLNQVLASVERLLVRLIGADVELTMLPLSGLGKVKADPGQIEQVIMNLAVNARDAMPRGGKLTIETANVQLDDAYVRDHDGTEPGAYVMLAVSDTGVGMDEATRERIFEPFFTTKEQGKGTGLGLSTVMGIVEQSGGKVWVYSEPGKGTTFKVYLPRVEADAGELAASGPQVAPASTRGSETILLVEDEEQVRAIACTVLRRSGYHVLESRNAGEALLVCEKHGGKIHLLLTDVVMPHMSGPQLAERVAALRPEMKVLFMSGYTGEAIVHHGVLDSNLAFLQKPITPAALLHKVREVLSAPDRRSTAPPRR